MSQAPQNVVLIIMDGFGLLPQLQGNAIVKAKTPFFDFLTQEFKSVALHAAGEAVGLPWGEMGNSEVGHLNIGTGRVVLQDYPQISKSIEDGSFFKNQVLLQAASHVKHYGSRLHLLGLVSKGAVHAHVDHLYGLLEFAKRQKLKEVFVHAILDGRDAPPRSAPSFIEPLLAKMAKEEIGQLATMIGRYYAMDRDRRYDRTKIAYEALKEAKGSRFDNPLESIESAYRKGKSDEFMPALIGVKDGMIKPKDAVIFFNFRADRAIQLTKAFVDPHFEGFGRKLQDHLYFVTLTNYEHKLPVDVAFTPIMLNDPQINPLSNCLAQVLSEHKLTQLHIAETEKYAHVTYFFNAGRQAEFEKETQILVPSPKVSTYDKAPKMSLPKIVEVFKRDFARLQPQFCVINFANADMLGHTGDFKATLAAIESIDDALAQVIPFASATQSVVLLTGDHGNAEQMLNPITKAIDKEHTVNPVPLIIVDKEIDEDSKKSLSIDQKLHFHATKPVGIFADVAPTILDYLVLKQPQEMTGTSLRGLI